MKKTIIILALFALGGCATSSKQQEKQWDLLFTTDSYTEKSPTIKDLMEKDFC